MELFGTMEVKNNVLHVGGMSSVKLVEEFGTPLYVVDEVQVRKICRGYRKDFKVIENGNKVAYAGKAFLSLAMCQLINSEGLCLDVVSGGELFTAYKSGFPLENVFFHGNNKTIDEINMGIELGVGTFVADNFYEIDKINEVAKKYNKIQRIFLRITPGIEAHTHDYIKTGQVDSKFGFTLLNNKTLIAVKKVIALSNVELAGIHCHIGSQIFEVEPYIDVVGIMMSLIKSVKDETGFLIKELDIGGGFGIYYKQGDIPLETDKFCSAILEAADKKVEELGIQMPILIIEPGRSIIGTSGTTLYTIGSIKDIPSIRKYVSVDGGMTDNIRPSLYNAEYECAIANRVKSNWTEVVTISGKCCESGDILLNNVEIPECYSGDLLAVLCTGAYGYSMSSNYNKIPKAPVVFVKDGKAKVVCRRETYEDLIEKELML
jgi:diaminopimelate decarboxylase